MKNKFKHPINYLAVLLAIISFSVGTVLLISYKMTGELGLFIIGYYHVLGAGLVNTIMLVILMLNAFFHMKEYRENLFTMLILILNIPIAALYFEWL